MSGTMELSQKELTTEVLIFEITLVKPVSCLLSSLIRGSRGRGKWARRLEREYDTLCLTIMLLLLLLGV